MFRGGNDWEVKFTNYLKSNPALNQSDGSSLLAKFLGNTYTASVYMSLASLLHSQGSSAAGKRILVFSYGSGCASSMYTVWIPSNDESIAQLSKIQKTLRLRERLDLCVARSVEDLIECTNQRLKDYHFKNGEYFPKGIPRSIQLLPGTFYLSKIDAHGRRTYDKTSTELQPKL